MADREDVGLILISIGFVVVVGGVAGVFYLRQSISQATLTPAMPTQNPAWTWTSPEQAKIDQYSDQIETDPSSFRAFLGRAEAHLRIRNYQAALDDYNSAIQLDPSSLKALRGRAAVSAKLLLLPTEQYLAMSVFVPTDKNVSPRSMNAQSCSKLEHVATIRTSTKGAATAVRTPKPFVRWIVTRAT